MSFAPIETLINALSSLAEVDQPHSLLKVLEEDLQAGVNGWPTAIVAADKYLGERLHSVMTDAVMLRPFEEVVVWGADDTRIMERTGLLVVGTHARQLLPGTLVAAIQVAASAGSPVLLLVDSMGRTSDPSAARAGIPRQLAAALPDVQVALVCLGDTRFEGPSVTEAASKAEELRLPSRRAHTLAAFRARAVSEALASRAEQVRLALRAASENAGLLRATEHGGTILASAEVGGWKQHLRVNRDALTAINIADVVSTARAQVSGAAVVRQAVEELRGRCEKGLKKTSKEAESLVLSDLDRITTALTRDITRSRETLAALGVMVEDTKPNLDSLQASIHPKLVEIIDRVVAGIEMPDQLLALAETLGRPNSTNDGTLPMPPAKEEKPAQSPPSDPKPNDDTPQPTPDDEKISSRLLRVLANAPERVIAARLHDALDEAMSEALTRCDHAVDDVCAAWSSRLEESIERAFAPFHTVAEEARHATGSRLDALVRAMQVVESIHGGG